jgi:hypothetical protein
MMQVKTHAFELKSPISEIFFSYKKTIPGFIVKKTLQE